MANGPPKLRYGDCEGAERSGRRRGNGLAAQITVRETANPLDLAGNGKKKKKKKKQKKKKKKKKKRGWLITQDSIQKNGRKNQYTPAGGHGITGNQG